MCGDTQIHWYNDWIIYSSEEWYVQINVYEKLLFHDVDEIYWPQPIRSLQLGYVTVQESMSPNWVGRVSAPGNTAVIKSVKIA